MDKAGTDTVRGALKHSNDEDCSVQNNGAVLTGRSQRHRLQVSRAETTIT